MSGWLELPAGERLALDQHGHLQDAGQWTPAVAEAFAAADGVVLGPGHWALVNELRAWHAEYHVEPPMRALLARMRERLEQPGLGSRDLYRLFPDGPVRTGSRYAGLPIPLSCI